MAVDAGTQAYADAQIALNQSLADMYGAMGAIAYRDLYQQIADNFRRDAAGSVQAVVAWQAAQDAANEGSWTNSVAGAISGAVSDFRGDLANVSGVVQHPADTLGHIGQQAVESANDPAVLLAATGGAAALAGGLATGVLSGSPAASSAVQALGADLAGMLGWGGANWGAAGVVTDTSNTDVTGEKAGTFAVITAGELLAATGVGLATGAPIGIGGGSALSAASTAATGAADAATGAAAAGTGVLAPVTGAAGAIGSAWSAVTGAAAGIAGMLGLSQTQDADIPLAAGTDTGAAGGSSSAEYGSPGGNGLAVVAIVAAAAGFYIIMRGQK